MPSITLEALLIMGGKKFNVMFFAKCLVWSSLLLFVIVGGILLFAMLGDFDDGWAELGYFAMALVIAMLFVVVSPFTVFFTFKLWSDFNRKWKAFSGVASVLSLLGFLFGGFGVLFIISSSF